MARDEGFAEYIIEDVLGHIEQQELFLLINIGILEKNLKNNMKNKEEMLKIFKENISFNKISVDESTIDIPKDRSDFISYVEFIKYFSDLKIITKHNVIIGINFTYGWMPTIFDFRSNDLEHLNFYIL